MQFTIKLAVAIGLILALNIAFCQAAKKGKIPKPEKLKAKPMSSSEDGAESEEAKEMEEMEESSMEEEGELMSNDTSKEEEIEEEPGLTLKGDDKVDAKMGTKVGKMEEEGSSKKSVKNFTCQVTGALLDMADSIKELSNDIKSIQKQMFEKCPGFEYNGTELLETDEDNMNDTDSETEVEEDLTDDVIDDGPKTTPLPPIPTECNPPFQPVASSCYYFLYYPSDWKTWGDANAYCQNLGGTLAAPHRLSDLREYLVESFSNVFWVGAKKTGKEPFKWLNGKEVDPKDWKDGQPSKTSARKNCVYLEYFTNYKAINHYCGEKFSFVCEERVDADVEE